jgi:hypothetical protein
VNPINRTGNVLSDARRYKLPYPVLAGRNSSILKDYSIRTLPLLMVIDRKGRIVLRKSFVKAGDLRQVLDALIKKEDTGSTSSSQ